MERLKMLKTIVNTELRDDEDIYITTAEAINDSSNEEWWRMYRYAKEDLYNMYTGKEWVKRFWHEDGLCIILK